MSTNDYDSMQNLIDSALTEMKFETGKHISYDDVNLAELQRRTGISRAKLRRWKDNGFTFLPHANRGRKAEHTVLTGYTGLLDSLLQQGVSNASVCLERLQEAGYQGGLTTIKIYLKEHQSLLPAKRQIIAPQGNRGRRYSTSPGEA